MKRLRSPPSKTPPEYPPRRPQNIPSFVLSESPQRTPASHRPDGPSASSVGGPSPGTTANYFRVPYKIRAQYRTNRARYIDAVGHIRHAPPDFDEVERSVRIQGIDAFATVDEVLAAIWEPFKTADLRAQLLTRKVVYFSNKVYDMRKTSGEHSVKTFIREHRRDEANGALRRYSQLLDKLAKLINEHNGLVDKMMRMMEAPQGIGHIEDDDLEEVEDGWVLANASWQV
ncbi:MAG: hypothetical protein Q9160_004619 [Pyrenula sp. 1 TL-2023]